MKKLRRMRLACTAAGECAGAAADAAAREAALRERICEIGRRMDARQMTAANDGNLSVRLGPDAILCTPTGVSKGALRPEMICKLSLSGAPLAPCGGWLPSSEHVSETGAPQPMTSAHGDWWPSSEHVSETGAPQPTTSAYGDWRPSSEHMSETGAPQSAASGHGKWRPSSEIRLHLAIYAGRPDVGAVVHAHPPYATVFAVGEQPLDAPITAEAVLALGSVPVVPYAAPSTDALADSVRPYLDAHEAVLLAHHGALTWGPDLTDAWYRMESLEFYAQLLYRVRRLGWEKPLPAAAVAELEARMEPETETADKNK